MDDKLNLGGKFSSSSSEEESAEDSTDSDSDEGSSDEDDEDRRKRSSKKKGKKKGSSSKSKKKKRSGKTRKITSRVLYPQDWPHSFLSLQYVDKEKKYDQLTMAEFCAGYCAIMEGIKDKNVVLNRLIHLKDLMYLTTNYKWKAVLNFHAAVLLEIERGHLKWGSSFHRLESKTLAGGLLRAPSGIGGSSAPSGSTRFSSGGNQSGNNQSTATTDSSNGPILFCKEYQRGVCSKTTDHEGLDRYGEMKFLRHMCANCWLKARRKLPHPETYEACPSRDL